MQSIELDSKMTRFFKLNSLHLSRCAQVLSSCRTSSCCSCAAFRCCAWSSPSASTPARCVAIFHSFKAILVLLNKVLHCQYSLYRFFYSSLPGFAMTSQDIWNDGTRCYYSWPVLIELNFTDVEFTAVLGTGAGHGAHLPAVQGRRPGHGGDLVPAGHLLQRDHGLGLLLLLQLVRRPAALVRLRPRLEHGRLLERRPQRDHAAQRQREPAAAVLRVRLNGGMEMDSFVS